MNTWKPMLILATVLWVSAEQDPPLSWNSALPLQAAVCDVAGIGRVLSRSDTTYTMQVDTLWIGNGSGLLEVTTRAALPTNDVPVVFFATKYQSFLDLEPMESRFSYILDMDYHRNRHDPDGLYLLNSDRSWIPVTPENADLISWSSNLVHAAQVTMNRQAFYELIRDGYRLNPDSSRIHRDSAYSFMHFHYYNDTTFMQQVWADPLLVGRARAWVNMSYQQETKTWLP